MTKVAFLDLARATAALRPLLEPAIAGILDTGRYILGPRLEELERAFAGHCGTAHGVGVGSGTDALALALAAGGVPVYADVDPRSYTLDPAAVAARITPRTRAIVPVHLYGPCADMDGILAVARRHGLRVIEDCAQAHGAQAGGRIAGSMGDAGCHSFYPTKNLGALGDAGMVVTDDAALAAEVRSRRHYGLRPGGGYDTRATNSRLDELQAAVLLATLPRLDERNDRRRAIAARYTAAFAGTRLAPPVEAPGRRRVYHLTATAFARGCRRAASRRGSTTPSPSTARRPIAPTRTRRSP